MKYVIKRGSDILFRAPVGARKESVKIRRDFYNAGLDLPDDSRERVRILNVLIRQGKAAYITKE